MNNSAQVGPMRITIIAAIYTFISLNVLAQSQRVYSFVGGEFPGILSLSKEGKYIGSAAEIISNASKKMHFKYKISIFPWARATKMVEQGKADVLIGPYKTVQREKYMNFTKNYFYKDSIIIVKNSSTAHKWNGDFTGLEKKKIGVVRGWSLGKKYEKYSNKLDVSHFESTTVLLKMLRVKRLDLIIVHNRSFYDDIVSQHFNPKHFTVLSPTVSTQKGYFGFSKKLDTEIFMEEFNRYIPIPTENIQSQFNLNF